MTRIRVSLLVGSIAYALATLNVIAVALVTAGPALFSDFRTWYSAIAPLCYCGYCVLTASTHLSTGILKWTGLLIHVICAPAIAYSFMCLGFLLPILSVLWFLMYRENQRQERLRRNCCPACAYSIGTSPVCTECGKQVQSPSVISQN